MKINVPKLDRRWIPGYIVIASALAYIPSVIFQHKNTYYDWTYFNSLSLLVRSSIIAFHHFPLHDPWVDGGLDLAANPQSRIFSPFLLLDLWFPPQWANILSLLIYSIFGMWGMYRLLKHLGVSARNALVGATLFINGSWFGLHFAEGHITFGSIQLLPWVAYFAMTLPSPRSLFGLSALLGFFIQNGCIYTFVYSIYLLITLLALKWVRWSQLRELFTRKRLYINLSSILLFGLLAATKLIPYFYLIQKRFPELDFFSVPAAQVPEMLFYPWQKNSDSVGFFHYRFHEIGCYLGLFSTFLIASQLTYKTFFKNQRRWFFMFLFWGWVALGWGGAFNPWHLVHFIPLLNNAHLQVRTLIFCFFAFVILVAQSLDALRSKLPTKRQYLLLGLTATLILESFVVRIYPLYRAYHDYSTSPLRFSLTTQTPYMPTVKAGDKPSIYFSRHPVLDAYEPMKISTQVKAFGERGYQGEAYSENKACIVSDFYREPGRMTFSAACNSDGVVTLNSNFLAGWRTPSPGAQVFRTSAGLIGISLSTGTHDVQIKYSPRYLPWVLTCLFLAWALFVFLFRLLVRF